MLGLKHNKSNNMIPKSVKSVSDFNIANISRNVKHLYWATRINKKYLAEVVYDENKLQYNLDIYKPENDKFKLLISRKVMTPNRNDDMIAYQKIAIDMVENIATAANGATA